jgi:hypothetical protein
MRPFRTQINLRHPTYTKAPGKTQVLECPGARGTLFPSQEANL